MPYDMKTLSNMMLQLQKMAGTCKTLRSFITDSRFWWPVLRALVLDPKNSTVCRLLHKEMLLLLKRNKATAWLMASNLLKCQRALNTDLRVDRLLHREFNYLGLMLGPHVYVDPLDSSRANVK